MPRQSAGCAVERIGYSGARPDVGHKRNVRPQANAPPEPIFALRNIRCTKRLGGLLKSYSRRAGGINLPNDTSALVRGAAVLRRSPRLAAPSATRRDWVVVSKGIVLHSPARSRLRIALFRSVTWRVFIFAPNASLPRSASIVRSGAVPPRREV